MSDPDPWCEEADGQYVPPARTENVTLVQADMSEDEGGTDGD